MTPTRWLHRFLDDRGLGGNNPDGRPLYAYRCSTEEFEASKAILRALANVTFAGAPLLGTPQLYTLVCAEWWRRYFQGGSWSWKYIWNELEWPHDQYHATIELVRDGLFAWKRSLITTSYRREFLVSVATEGGIPINLLQCEGGSFRDYLRTVVSEYGLYGDSGLNALEAAEQYLSKLRENWRQPQIAQLAGQVAEAVWRLTAEMGDRADTVDELNHSRPEWIDQLPIVAEQKQAELLIRSLFEEAKKTAASRSSILKAQRMLQRDGDNWALRVRLVLPREIPVDQVTEMSRLTTATLPENLEMYRVSAGSRTLIARLAKFGNSYLVHPLTSASGIVEQSASGEQEVALVNRGRMLGNLPVTGGSALDDRAPWCFVPTDLQLDDLRFAAHGGYRGPAKQLLVLSQAPPLPTEDPEREFERIALDPLRDSRDLWLIDREATIEETEGDRYLVLPGAKQREPHDYRVFGQRRYVPTTALPLYEALPTIQLVAGSIPSVVPWSELTWRPAGERDWRKVESRDVIGELELRHVRDGFTLYSWKLAVLPRRVAFKLLPRTRTEGALRVSGLNGEQAHLQGNKNISIALDESHACTEFSVTRDTTGEGSIQGRVRGVQHGELHFHIPFPAEGAAFIDSTGEEFDKNAELPISKFWRVRAQSLSLNNRRRYWLTGQLVHAEKHLPALRHHSFSYPMTIDDSGACSIPLQQVGEDIKALFAMGTGPEDRVNVTLAEKSQVAPEAKVSFRQFAAMLNYDEAGGVISLVAEDGGTEDFSGNQLRIVAVNDITSPPVWVGWSDPRHGWLLSGSDQLDRQNAYFATVDGDYEMLVRPLFIPRATDLGEDASVSDLQRALLANDSTERADLLRSYLPILEDRDTGKHWDEFLAWFGRLQFIHPDTIDVVEVMIQRPRIMATLFLESASESTLLSMLQLIVDTTPFDWWLVPIDDWLAATQEWSRNRLLSVENEQARQALLARTRAHLLRLQETREEVNAAVDIVLESLAFDLPPTSLLSTARRQEPAMTWALLDQLIRSSYLNEIGDATWPAIPEIATLRRHLPAEIFKFIDWPGSGARFRIPVIHAPIVAAATMQSGIEITQNERIALMAARNFFPPLFGTLFRATQATLWVHHGESAFEAV